MSLRRLAGWGSFILFFCLLAWCTGQIFRDPREDMLVCAWNSTFRRLDGACIYWITMRLAAWILLYLCLLRLENGFSVYLFLRQKSFGRVFARTYGTCVVKAACYYGIGTLVMAVCQGLAFSRTNAGNFASASGILANVLSSGTYAGNLLGTSGLPRILAEEGLEALNFCLAAYAVHCLCRKTEAGFLAVLAGRLVLNLATGGGRPGLPIQLAVNLGLMGVVFFMAFRNFAEKFIDG